MRSATLPMEVQIKEAESSSQVRSMNERIMSSTEAPGASGSRDYRVGPDDLLEIVVFEEENLNRTVRVSAQGNISLPLLGVLKAKGLTANELEKEIRDLLEEKYLRNPQVGVFIREYRNQRISVTGAVEKPGVFDVTGQKTILDLLALSGGLKEDAGPLLFLIRRGNPSSEDKTTQDQKAPEKQAQKAHVIDLEELLFKGDLALNLPLMHGDTINVPVSGKIFVAGQVIKPGGFSLKGKKVTAGQAIAMAEGLKEDAEGSGAKIFRYSGKNREREIVAVNIPAILKGEAEDPRLQENDILVVPKNGFKAFLLTFKDFTKGLVGFGFSL